MTRKQIFDQVVNTLGLQDDTTFNETDFVNQLIFQATTDILASCRPNMRAMDLTIQPNTPIHDMSTQVIAISDISLMGDEGEEFLDRYTREDISAAQESGAPGYCYDEPMLWISPIVDVSSTIRAYGVFRPLQMLSDNDSPADQQYGGLAPEFHPAIVIYCLWKAAEYVEHESSGYGEKWHVQYSGTDGNGGEIARIKRIMSKRVTAQANKSRALGKNLGYPSNNLRYLGG